MPVYVQNLRWPNARIPYEIAAGANAAMIGPAVQEINRCIGWHILVDRLPADAAYISIADGGGNAGAIGRRGNFAHNITANNTRVVIHEVLHVLGFLHEQYHTGYPWDEAAVGPAPARPAVVDFSTRSGFAFTYQGREGSAWNTQLYAQLINQYGVQFGADNQLDTRRAAIGDPNVLHYLQCDLNSVMMYNNSANAIAPALAAMGPVAVLPANANYHASGNHARSSPNCLSNFDVQGLRHAYPNPGVRCVMCGDVHGWWISVINHWHQCTLCFAIYCPTDGANLAGKRHWYERTRACNRAGCAGRTRLI